MDVLFVGHNKVGVSWWQAKDVGGVGRREVGHLVVQHDASRGREDLGAEGGVDRGGERDRHAVRVDDREVRGALVVDRRTADEIEVVLEREGGRGVEALAQVRGVLLGGHGGHHLVHGVELRVALGHAVREGELEGLDDPVLREVRGRAHERQVEGLEQIERQRVAHAAERRGGADDLEALKEGRQRLGDAHAVLPEPRHVVHGHDAADGRHVVGDVDGDRARVVLDGALGGDGGERVGERRLQQRVALLQQRAAGRKDRLEARELQNVLFVLLDALRQQRAHDRALGEFDRRLEQVGPRDIARAKVLVQVLEARDLARHRDRQAADRIRRRIRAVDEHVLARIGRRHLAEVHLSRRAIGQIDATREREGE